MNRLMESPPAARTLIGGRWRDYFSGCSYLGLPGHPDLIEAAVDALRRYGLTTSTSRGGYGEHPVYHAVEAAAARFFDMEAATYYVSAYLGSIALLQALAGEYERAFVDEVAHFSVRDAARIAGTPYHAFHHCAPDDLAAQLRHHLAPGERPLVLTDGIFPISGEIAPAADYAAVLAEYEGAVLCLDDAHATGVIGKQGRGTAEYQQVARVAPHVRIYTAHTLSKALGGHGGLVAADAAFVAQMEERAVALGASSPPPLPAAAASAWALDFVVAHPERREQLWANVARARAGFRGLGWELEETPSPILCLRARPGLDLARIQAELFEQDLCVAHVTRYSSTPAGGALRVAIFATHSADQIDRLVQATSRCL